MKEPFVFHFESCLNRQLRLLRSKSNHVQSVYRGKTEFQKMALLKAWVYGKLDYSFSSPVPNLRNSLEILEKTREGVPFLCSSYAALYMQTAQSMGWTARYFFLRRPGGLQHAAVEVWSNQYRKWVYIDPTWNIHTELKGVPCSLLELRDQWLRNGGRSLAYIYGAGKERVIYRRSQFPVKRRDSELWEKLPLDKGWLSYTYEIALVGRNDFFSQGDGSGENIWDSIYIFKDILNEEDEKWPFRSRPALTRKELSAPLNVPEVTMLFPPGRNVTVTLNSRGKKSFTPDFGHFEIFHKGKWRHVPRHFTISKKEWFRGIRLRTVSLCGVSGPSLFLKKGK